MRLSLIGMSGSGKSIWSIKLSEMGFMRFCCDDLIARKLAPELVGRDGLPMELGVWMGWPYHHGYREREARYLACEIEALNEILDALESHGSREEENIVVDTTGSVIYTGESLLRRLRQNTTIVLFASPRGVQEKLLKAYLDNKRPVLWKEMFNKGPGETNEEALARCYPRLLSSRERLYARYADVTIDYHILSREGFGVEDFLRMVHFKEI